MRLIFFSLLLFCLLLPVILHDIPFPKLEISINGEQNRIASEELQINLKDKSKTNNATPTKPYFFLDGHLVFIPNLNSSQTIEFFPEVESITEFEKKAALPPVLFDKNQFHLPQPIPERDSKPPEPEATPRDFPVQQKPDPKKSVPKPPRQSPSPPIKAVSNSTLPKIPTPQSNHDEALKPKQPQENFTALNNAMEKLRSLRSNLNPNIQATDSKLFSDSSSSKSEKNGTVGQVKNDNHEIEKYLANVRKQIERNKIYPDSALKQGIQGKVLVTFSIAEDGCPINIQIPDSTSFQLKNAARDLFKNRTFPPPPSSLKAGYRIEIPINYSLH
ncbi:MAG: energy transducer TonB [Candidatus Riflebacteria bacterium]|nr:energy transducer TonB [Candidatus Riflebacteria bacterium]